MSLNKWLGGEKFPFSLRKICCTCSHYVVYAIMLCVCPYVWLKKWVNTHLHNQSSVPTITFLLPSSIFDVQLTETFPEFDAWSLTAEHVISDNRNHSSNYQLPLEDVVVTHHLASPQLRHWPGNTSGCSCKCGAWACGSLLLRVRSCDTKQESWGETSMELVGTWQLGGGKLKHTAWWNCMDQPSPASELMGLPGGSKLHSFEFLKSGGFTRHLSQAFLSSWLFQFWHTCNMILCIISCKGYLLLCRPTQVL